MVSRSVSRILVPYIPGKMEARVCGGNPLYVLSLLSYYSVVKPATLLCYCMALTFRRKAIR